MSRIVRKIKAARRRRKQAAAKDRAAAAKDRAAALLAGDVPLPKDLDSLTIVLLVRDTPQYLNRWLSWAELNQATCHILVADGSRDNACRDVVAPFLKGHLRLRYRQSEPDISRAVYYKKIVAALAEVETPFVAVMADDDLPWFDGMPTALQALMANPAAVSARGRIHDFECTPDPLSIGCKEAVWRIYEPDSIISCEDPLKRLNIHFTEYCLTYHDIIRSDISRMIFNQQLTAAVLDPNLNELFLSALLVASGPVLRVHPPYLLRASRPNSIGTVLSKNIDLFDEFFQPGWMSQYESILEAVGAILPAPAENGTWRDFLHRCFRRFYAPIIIRSLVLDASQSRFRVECSGSISPHIPSPVPPDSLHETAKSKCEIFLRSLNLKYPCESSNP